MPLKAETVETKNSTSGQINKYMLMIHLPIKLDLFIQMK